MNKIFISQDIGASPNCAIAKVLHSGIMNLCFNYFGISCKMSKIQGRTKKDSAKNRSYTLKYFLNKGRTKIKILQAAGFLGSVNTLVIGEWTVNFSNNKSNCGMFEEFGEMQGKSKVLIETIKNLIKAINYLI